MIWYPINHLHINQKWSKFLNRQRFWINSIHTTFKSFLYIFILYMTSNGNDLWLELPRNVHVQIQCTNLVGCLVTIHEWHVAIHQDQWISVGVVFIHCFSYSAHCLFTVVCKFSVFLAVLKTQNHKKTINNITIELLIINNQDLASIILGLLQHLFLSFIHSIKFGDWVRWTRGFLLITLDVVGNWWHSL